MRGRMGAGTVHHVAFRARDNAEQLAWRDAIIALDYNVTPVLDRQYFHSIYFREPGGVLFEIATDPPGFAVLLVLRRATQSVMSFFQVQPQVNEENHSQGDQCCNCPQQTQDRCDPLASHCKLVELPASPPTHQAVQSAKPEENQ